MAYVIGDDCIKCGACAEGCPVSAISEGDDKYVIDLRFLRLFPEISIVGQHTRRRVVYVATFP